MTWFITGIILTVMTVGIMKDTHFKCYNGMKVVEESEARIPLWFFIMIIAGKVVIKIKKLLCTGI